ncbi:MAG: hypothetical protein IPN29_00690 [Saprospiraceae bacterium]|nr:hypothetical protein [Saprospiraceae bacterium]
MFFIGAYGSEEALFSTDGTSEGTSLVCSGLGATLENLVCIDDVLYFTANRGKLYQLHAGNAFPKFIMEKVDIRELLRLDDLLIFKSNDGISGHTMWALDGKDGMVNLTKLIEPGAYEPLPSDFYIFDKKVFFLVYNENKVRELWSTDGTKAGTSLVKGIIGSPGNVDAISMAATDSLIYITLVNYFVGSAVLWRSDGTAEGTFKLTSYQNYDIGTWISTFTWKIYFIFMAVTMTMELSYGLQMAAWKIPSLYRIYAPASVLRFPDHISPWIQPSILLPIVQLMVLNCGK